MYYKDLKNELYVDPILENHVGLIEITEVEFNELLTIKNTPTQEQLLAQQKAEAKQYLNDTDWYVTRKIETGVDVPEEITIKRAEARALI